MALAGVFEPGDDIIRYHILEKVVLSSREEYGLLSRFFRDRVRGMA